MQVKKKNSKKQVLPYTAESFIRQKKLLIIKLKDLNIDIEEEEVAKITFLSRRKYNRYAHFPKGESFESRLLNWLKKNFETDERQAAMEIVKSISFISEDELKSLALKTFHNAEDTIMSSIQNLSTLDWLSYLSAREIELMQSMKRSLFVALADDIAFDYIRRYASFRYNFEKDNFVEYYKLNEESLDKLPDFDRVFLIDHFSGSGTTALSFREGAWDGKIPRFLSIWKKRLVDVTIYYCPEIISSIAEQNLNKNLIEFLKSKNGINLYVTPTIQISISKCLSQDGMPIINEDSTVANLCFKYYDRVVEDKNTKLVGNIMYGYGRAGLTLVFESNCPNNSIPLLWNLDNNWYPLFPRVKHHR